MFTIFKNSANFDNLEFVQDLQENGFDIHNTGGTFNPDFSNGEIYNLKNNQYRLLGETSAILTCHANIFFKTLLDVEKRFNYQLFG